MNQKIYFAPLEGITGYIYRNAHKKYFGGVDKYFTPFIVTNQSGSLKSKELNDILPEHNEGIPVVPQILGNKADEFIQMAKRLEQLGYKEVNLNLGCPSGTVVSKKRGAGFLAYPEELDAFLEEISSNISIGLSVKTRIGKEDPEEFGELLRIYNQYPLTELIIHPRVQQDYYKNTPNREIFRQAVSESKNKLCYNGDIFHSEDYREFQKEFPTVEIVMLGRGMIANPALADEIIGGKHVNKEVLKAFHDEVCQDYQEIFSGDRNVLFKMKELWFYMSEMFTNPDKYAKKIRKTQKLTEYNEMVLKLFEEQDLIQ